MKATSGEMFLVNQERHRITFRLSHESENFVHINAYTEWEIERVLIRTMGQDLFYNNRPDFLTKMRMKLLKLENLTS